MTLITRIRKTVTALTQPFSEPLEIPSEFEVAERGSPGRERDVQFCRTMAESERADDRTLARAWRQVEETMAFVPGGETKLTPLISPEGTLEDAMVPAGVDAIYIDRFAITNEQFFEFVDDGGYDREDFSAAESLPHLLRFIDQSGTPGPKYWKGGQPPPGKPRHPIVGVSWYESQAFARWAGRRLPTPAEWQHAACWFAGTDGPLGSYYPWGNAFDPARANTWHGELKDTVAVDAFRSGATPNGVYQMIGNVWEWTDLRLEDTADELGNRLTFEQSMAEVRGGAYDTYFETQATSRFRTGQGLLYRGPNVGFRCCVSVRDLPAPPDPSAFLLEDSK